MKLEQLLKEWNIQAVIFDLDGTLIDNNAFHLKSWRKYLEDIKRPVSDEEYLAHINGRTNKDAVQYIYGKKMSDEEAMVYTLEKEKIYRNLYEPHIKPVNGLLEILTLLDEKKLPMGIATSGIEVNIDFMFNHISIRKYFSCIVNSQHIKKGKPDPEIYLTTATRLKVSPTKCLVFEDAVVGIKAARSAGMKVIAVATTHDEQELAAADLVIKDFTALLEKVNP
jgi:beta-phosphoglucomutase